MSMPIPSKSPLPTEKTEIFPLPSMHIQATLDGNRDILETVMKGALKFDSGWFNGKSKLISGDRSAYRVPGSLAFYASMLGRSRVILGGPDFHAANELLQHMFDAMVVRVWELDLGCDDLEAGVHGMPDYILQEKLEQCRHSGQAYEAKRPEVAQLG
ncbi:hypothetical protein BX616_003468 [Lobosporangium transversale]|nr:hypothetical protein BX616_003468 [Lobosporangium transversale]